MTNLNDRFEYVTELLAKTSRCIKAKFIGITLSTLGTPSKLCRLWLINILVHNGDSTPIEWSQFSHKLARRWNRPMGNKLYIYEDSVTGFHHTIAILSYRAEILACLSIWSAVPMASADQSQLCRESATPASMSMSLCDDDGVQRRIGDYHSNLWDDDFIQSLSTPYGVSN